MASSQQDKVEAARQQAAQYLRDNDELRSCLNIGKDSLLEPFYLGAGEHNRNFRFLDPSSGRTYVLRVNVTTQPFHENQVAYEYNALTCLKPSECAPEPLYLDDSPTALEKGVLVISFCEGKQLDFDHLRPGDIRCAAQLMANIHAVSAPKHSPLYRPQDPLRELFEECLQRFEFYRTSAFEDERITKWGETFISVAGKQLDTPCKASDCSHIINTETLPSHFLIPAESARAAAASTDTTGPFCQKPGFFVDWERPIIGEVAQDVAYFISPTTTFWDSDYLFPANEVEGFLNDYWRAVDGRFSQGCFFERFTAFRVMTALRSVTWCCKALINYQLSSNAHKTEKTMKKLPIYLSDDFMERLAEECFGL